MGKKRKKAVVKGDAPVEEDRPKADVNGVATVIGYGTFISRSFYLGKKNVRVVTIKGYRRVFSQSIARFPFALPEPSSSFKAIAFDIDSRDFVSMDRYEGCGQDPTKPNGALYYRAQVDAVEKDGKVFKAWMYIAGERSYNEVKLKSKSALSPEIDKDDKWIDELRNFPDVVSQFPELFN